MIFASPSKRGRKGVRISRSLGLFLHCGSTVCRPYDFSSPRPTSYWGWELSFTVFFFFFLYRGFKYVRFISIVYSFLIHTSFFTFFSLFFPLPSACLDKFAIQRLPFVNTQSRNDSREAVTDSDKNARSFSLQNRRGFCFHSPIGRVIVSPSLLILSNFQQSNNLTLYFPVICRQEGFIPIRSRGFGFVWIFAPVVLMRWLPSVLDN